MSVRVISCTITLTRLEVAGIDRKTLLRRRRKRGKRACDLSESIQARTRHRIGFDWALYGLGRSVLSPYCTTLLSNILGDIGVNPVELRRRGRCGRGGVQEGREVRHIVLSGDDHLVVGRGEVMRRVQV